MKGIYMKSLIILTLFLMGCSTSSTNFFDFNRAHLKQFIISNQIEKGKAKIAANIYFNKENQNNYEYKVIGEIKEAKLNIINYRVDCAFSINALNVLG